MPPCCKYSLGTARWWVSASRLTGGTQDKITTDTIRIAKSPIRRLCMQPIESTDCWFLFSKNSIYSESDQRCGSVFLETSGQLLYSSLTAYQNHNSFISHFWVCPIIKNLNGSQWFYRLFFSFSYWSIVFRAGTQWLSCTPALLIISFFHFVLFGYFNLFAF